MGLKVLDLQSLDHMVALRKLLDLVAFIFELASLTKDTILGIHIEDNHKLVEDAVDTKGEVKVSIHTDKFAVVVVLEHKALASVVVPVHMAFVAVMVLEHKALAIVVPMHMAFVAMMVLEHRVLAGRVTKCQVMEAAQIFVVELVLPL